MSADKVSDDDEFWVIKVPKLKTTWSYEGKNIAGVELKRQKQIFEIEINRLIDELKNMWRKCQPTPRVKAFKAHSYADPKPLEEFTQKLESLKNVSQKLGQCTEAEKITEDASELNRKAARFMGQLHQNMSELDGKFSESDDESDDHIRNLQTQDTQTQTTAQAQSRDKNLFV